MDSILEVINLVQIFVIAVVRENTFEKHCVKSLESAKRGLFEAIAVVREKTLRNTMKSLERALFQK
jgi:predicted acetyltransferase